MSTRFQVALHSAVRLVQGGMSEPKALATVVANHKLDEDQARAMRHRVQVEMDAQRVAATGMGEDGDYVDVEAEAHHFLHPDR